MRFDEFVLRVPGDEFRIRFHEQLTVLAGVGPEERDALITSILGALTGNSEGATLRYTDHTGRPAELTSLAGRAQARFTDDDTVAPSPIGWFAPDAATLRELLVLTPADLGLGVDSSRRDDDPPELADARAALWTVEQERQAALDARAAVEASLTRMGELDEAIRAAEGDAARREYAKVVAQLDRVRGEAAVIESGDEGRTADAIVLQEADGLHRLAGRWLDAADAVDALRAEAPSDEEAGALDVAEIPWMARIPPLAPEDLGALLTRSAEAERRVTTVKGALHELVTATLHEPDEPDVVTLATADQDELWAAHSRLDEAAAALEREQLRIGGIGQHGPPTATIETMEVAHARWEAADTLMQERRVTVIGGGTLLALLAAPAASTGPLFPALILLTVLVGVGELLGRPALRRARAARAERESLIPLGVPTYLAFHMRRVDATIDPKGRDQLELAEAELGLAERAWAAVAGGVAHETARRLAGPTKVYAAELRSQRGALDDLAELRRVLDEQVVPDRDAAKRDLLATLEPFGVSADDLDGVTHEVVAAVVAARVGLGDRARHQQALDAAERAEAEAGDLLDDVLVHLGHLEGTLATRFEAAGWAIEKATERDDARANARPASEVEADLARLGAEARRLRRPEFAALTAEEAGDLDVEALITERGAMQVSLAEHERAGADLDRLSDRLAALQHRVGELEAEHAGGRVAHDADRAQRAVLAHLAKVAALGPMAEPVPVLLDDPLGQVAAERKWELMDMLRRLGERTQVLYLTDDAFIGAWARRRAQVEESITLLEPVE